MVFRQLQLVFVVATFLGGACGEEGASTSTSIEIEVDSQSCFTAAEGLTLSCTSTAIVVVVDQGGETIAEDCATLPAGRLIDSAQVIQDTLSLGSLPSDIPLRISLSIHSGVLSPCPQTNATSSAFLSGNTPLVTLSEQSSGIALLLRCADLGGPGGPVEPASEECATCDSNLQVCTATNGLNSCETIVANCELPCFDVPDVDRCFLSCDILDSNCTDSVGGVVLNCEGDQDACLDSCPVDVPADFCSDACIDAAMRCSFYQELQTLCNNQHQSCLSDCGAETSCLSLGF